ncbi:LANO_0D05028g1_1 [Lachancea nothofagi CBS 11611]|uniref:LANO_0D05028g1_1 n=1 Tax=Lachancea nothofagi CBS 11611 TaxID=1266666 RepID=A0A1G4JGJ8_9SACH|nr:LANO_0D05028g1_1 [Lachancea nothofagi CBS 11611]
MPSSAKLTFSHYPIHQAYIALLHLLSKFLFSFINYKCLEMKTDAEPKKPVAAMDANSNRLTSSLPDRFQKPDALKARLELPGRSGVSRLMKPEMANPSSMSAQAGCSTLRGGGYRNKVSLKPGYSAMDWSELSNTKGKRGMLIAGIEKLINDPEIQRFNNPQALMGLQHGLPPFKIFPPLKVNRAQLEKHTTRDDCWCVLKKRVYCISSYLDFHPGGPDILIKTAGGKDATALFDKYHRWVNYERLLETCYIGEYIS